MVCIHILYVCHQDDAKCVTVFTKKIIMMSGVINFDNVDIDVVALTFFVGQQQGHPACRHSRFDHPRRRFYSGGLWGVGTRANLE